MQGVLWTLGHDEALPTKLDASWGLCADEFEASGGFPPALYVRAARRLLGDRVFTQNSPAEQRAAGGIGTQSIGIGCYNFDSHTAQRVACPSKAACLGGAPPGVAPGQAYAWMEGDVEIAPGKYQVPLYAVLPKRDELANLLVVSAPSASHIGMSTLRMEPQFMIIGHSVGVAAAQAAAAAKAGGADVHTLDLGKLHEALLADGQIVEPE